MSLPISAALSQKIAQLGQHLNLAPEEVLDVALERLTEQYIQPQAAPSRPIQQGDLYWVQVTDIAGERIPHPHVILQDDVFNRSRLPTVIVCGLTSNLKRAALPGNLILQAGEGKLERASVVEVSKVSSLPKTHLGAYIGSLSQARVDQIMQGMRFLQRSMR
jgi:mRNA interferase MazF